MYKGFDYFKFSARALIKHPRYLLLVSLPIYLLFFAGFYLWGFAFGLAPITIGAR